MFLSIASVVLAFALLLPNWALGTRISVSFYDRPSWSAMSLTVQQMKLLKINASSTVTDTVTIPGSGSLGTATEAMFIRSEASQALVDFYWDSACGRGPDYSYMSSRSGEEVTVINRTSTPLSAKVPGSPSKVIEPRWGSMTVAVSPATRTVVALMKEGNHCGTVAVFPH